MAQGLLQAAGERPADDVGRRSRREAHDDSHGFGWIRLRKDHAGKSEDGRQDETPEVHQIFSVSPLRGCHTRRRRSASVTAQSSSNAKIVSTTIPATTALKSNVPSACRMR